MRDLQCLIHLTPRKSAVNSRAVPSRGLMDYESNWEDKWVFFWKEILLEYLRLQNLHAWRGLRKPLGWQLACCRGHSPEVIWPDLAPIQCFLHCSAVRLHGVGAAWLGASGITLGAWRDARRWLRSQSAESRPWSQSAESHLHASSPISSPPQPLPRLPLSLLISPCSGHTQGCPCSWSHILKSQSGFEIFHSLPTPSL